MTKKEAPLGEVLAAAEKEVAKLPEWMRRRETQEERPKNQSKPPKIDAEASKKKR